MMLLITVVGVPFAFVCFFCSQAKTTVLAEIFAAIALVAVLHWWYLWAALGILMLLASGAPPFSGSGNRFRLRFSRSRSATQRCGISITFARGSGQC
jgi:hypothetical protein